ELAAVDVLDAQPLELCGVPGVGVLVGLLLGVDVDLQVDASQRLGVCAVGDLLEAHVPAARLGAGGGDGQGALAPGDADGEDGTGAQALLRLVGAQRERDLAAQAVCSADGRDDDVERAHERPPWFVPCRSSAWAPTNPPSPSSPISGEEEPTASQAVPSSVSGSRSPSDQVSPSSASRNGARTWSRAARTSSSSTAAISAESRSAVSRTSC